MKNTSQKLYIIISCLWAVLSSCGDNRDLGDNTNSPVISSVAKPELVKTTKLILKNFDIELFANGKLEASHHADLRFNNDGIITFLPIKEGEYVKKGQLLAKIDDSQAIRNYRQAELHYKQSYLDYNDQLLRAGYHLADTNKIDDKVKSICRLRSGLSQAEIDMQQALAASEATRLCAPFSGKIANLKANIENRSGVSNNICSIVDDGILDVNFQLMEQEQAFVHSGANIKIVQFNGNSPEIPGYISSINPIIDQGGMISVKATVDNKNGKLLDGANVKIKVLKSLRSQMVVPREAVLDRQGRKVVFTVEKGLAKWNYVEIAFENSTQYVIKSGLTIGNQIIINGNFNLANDKPVMENRQSD